MVHILSSIDHLRRPALLLVSLFRQYSLNLERFPPISSILSLPFW
ncbi:Protein of unknown function [Pyronema omphalodes CBS 100304]|uniref:Uncharacterized protein n=1 Tax=Pyronema omphalodes (strain CBS 100304) TaxID=1076935 RepID=U4LGM8_PYROM|nr:Protein of unknown function [Pyronema omphalodes CBS 100304]